MLFFDILIYAIIVFLIFLKEFIYLFLERAEGKERGRETSMVAPHTPPTGNLAHDPKMCPDWEPNW